MRILRARTSCTNSRQPIYERMKTYIISNPRPTVYSLTRTALKLFAMLVIVASAGATTEGVYAQTEDEVVAVVNGKSITRKEVDNSVISQILPLQQQIHALRKAALENLVLRAVLEGEAKKRGVSVEELRKQLTAGKVEVSTSQVEQVYLENASIFAGMSPDEARERIRLDLESQARMRNYREAISRLKEGSDIKLHLEGPKLPHVADGQSSSARGAQEARVTITEFSDFQCPYCRQVQGAIKQVLQSYGDDVRLLFRHLPLEIHSRAFPAAQAAFCAGEQGLFWQYHDALFASASLSPDALDGMATELGLNMTSFKACLGSEVSRAAVFKDVQEARRLGINGTPAFIINGTLIRGAIGYEDFKAIVEQELKSAQSISRSK